jgi:hypothetical protein
MRASVAALGGCALLAIAGAAGAQDELRANFNVFISPSGEPFRAAKDAPYPVDVWFARADTDHDGALSEAEFVADSVGFFHKIDLNGDGVVDGGEVSAYEQKTAPEILPHVIGLTARDIPPLPKPRTYDGGDASESQQEDEQPRRRAGPAVDGAMFYSLIREAEPVAAADLDFDGKITLAEFKASARRKFAELDLDHDGKLERAELRKTDAQRMAEKQASRDRSKDKPKRP